MSARWLFNDGDARTWSYVDETGTVLATLEPDAASGNYKDGNGRLLGRKWEDARAKAEESVKKGSKQR